MANDTGTAALLTVQQQQDAVLAQYYAEREALRKKQEAEAAAIRAEAEKTQVVQYPKSSGISAVGVLVTSQPVVTAVALADSQKETGVAVNTPLAMPQTITQSQVSTVATGTSQAVTVQVQQEKSAGEKLVDSIVDWASARIGKHQPVYRKVMYEYPDFTYRFTYGEGRFIITAAEAGQLYLNAGGKDATQWLSEGTTKLTSGSFRGIVRINNVWFDANMFSINALGEQEWDAQFTKYWPNAIDISRVTAKHYNASVQSTVAKDVNITVSNPFVSTGSGQTTTPTTGGGAPTVTTPAVGSGAVAGGGGAPVVTTPAIEAQQTVSGGGFKEALPLIVAGIGLYTALK